MTSDVGITELRRHLGRYLQRVERSERLIVTNRTAPWRSSGHSQAAGDSSA